MYINFNILCAIFAIGILHSNCEYIDKEISEKEIESIIIQNGECGGTIEMDQGILIYPGEGSIQPGELCVWTIHLRTMDGFRVNFTEFNLPGGNTNCTRSALSIYGLSNLIPRDTMEGYRLCNENNNIGYYFLTSNIATVVFYSSSNFPINNTAYGFHLHWEGSRFQPIPTEHSASFQIAPNGVIWYPFEGEYPPYAGMTWSVKGVRSVDPVPSLVDIDVIFVDLETCNLSDKCLCDALIIYDISPTGELHEIDRFCGDQTAGQFHNKNTNFIVAFYTDGPNAPSSGYGFQVAWRQGSGTPPTTTTESWEVSTDLTDGTTGWEVSTDGTTGWEVSTDGTTGWEVSTDGTTGWEVSTEGTTGWEWWTTTTEDYTLTTTEDYWQTTPRLLGADDPT